MRNPESTHPGICSFLAELFKSKGELYVYWRDILVKVPAEYELESTPHVLKEYVSQHGALFVEELENEYGPERRYKLYRMLLLTKLEGMKSDHVASSSAGASSLGISDVVSMPGATSAISRPHFADDVDKKIIWFQEEAHAAGTITLTPNHTWEHVTRAAQQHYAITKGGASLEAPRSSGKPATFWSNRTAKSTARPNDDVLMRIWYMGKGEKSGQHSYVPGKTFGFRLYKDGKTNVVSIQTLGA
jgi:hypothetical protein